MAKKYRSKTLSALHEAMQDLHRVGLLGTQTMREFDASCLVPVEKLSPKRIAESGNGAKNIRTGRH